MTMRTKAPAALMGVLLACTGACSDGEHGTTGAAIATSSGRVEVQRGDGISVMDSPLKNALREAGFSQTHRSLIAYGARS